ncbi:GTP 3',8-cyclase MoaA [Candidatus Nitronereus thalassa]|uniref:GTP 3',8-cyclase n=1 Tax=Candidatus Nitronereus thalassa TaxID=3020898 RepID=A0ABU3K6F8_9BACT|nr:GTP 3',8-cyclase MoaA [Candidatus Nitronereus thalassa]MDT7041932.1 GTP 3',8-cyclase MoaA [Candidatus Nitronereus thalassa]
MSLASGQPMTSELLDTFDRPLRSLRLSVTDRCNLRCQYCMPEEEYAWLPRDTLLTFEEINVLVSIFAEFGVDRIRLTGGEPLLRRDLPTLIRMIGQHARIQDIALTTNGILLNEQAQALFDAGLHRVTVSLDTLKPDRFKTLTRRETFDRVLEGIAIVEKVGFTGLKIDTVAIKGFNDDELVALIEYGKSVNAEVRFIEYMDVGGANDWSLTKVLSRAEILLQLRQTYGPIEPLIENSSAPAQRFLLSDGTTFGIIPSTTTPFCATCDRSRLTADGFWYLCLYAKQGIDLREPLRLKDLEEVRSRIRSGWGSRTDRGAEDRKNLEQSSMRGRFIEIEKLRQDPRLEMHARGG